MDIFQITRTEPQTHMFKTDNVRMNELGLGVFTTGILYEYFNERKSDGKYSNRDAFVSVGYPISISEARELIGDTGKWEGFRRTEYTGQYVEQSTRKWSLNEFEQVQPYDIGMVPLDLFAPDEKFGTVDAMQPLDGLDGTSPGLTYVPFYVPTSRSKGISREPGVFEVEMQRRAKEDGRFLVGSDVMNVISMNNFMIDLKKQFPRSTWSDLPEEYTLSSENLFAMDEFLIDIKTSKSNGMYGSGEVTFFIQMAGGQFQCDVTEWVSWELMLRDKAPSKRQDARGKAIISNQLVADYKRDETQRKYRSNIDGSISTPNTSKDQGKTVASMSMNYNAYKDKWESGTTSMMALVSGDIPAAPFTPNMDILATGDVKEILNSSNEKDKVTFGSGLAMPVFMQNSNPYHWAPNYADVDRCKESTDKKKKQTVKVYNFNPKKSYINGDTVILSEIGGVWHIMDPGIGEEEPEQERVNGKWEFNYRMTNFQYFFKGYRKREASSQVDRVGYTPSTAERYFHLNYYINDDKNNSDKASGPGRRYNNQFSTKNLDSYYFPDGSWQMTSFDFMDSKILGRRGLQSPNGLTLGNGVDKNALNTTQAAKDAAGREIPLGNRERNAAHSGPFFGCVFPDGYVTPADLISEERNFNILYHNSGAPETSIASFSQDRASYPYSDTPLQDVGSRFLAKFSETKDNYTEEYHPFLDPPEISEVTETRFPLGIRSDPRSAVNVAGDEPFSDLETWIRLNPKQGPSMFGLFTDGSDTSLDQLPADIALNGHISSDYGSPLYDIHRTNKFYEYNHEGDTSESSKNLRKESKAAFVKCCWIRKKDAPTAPGFDSEDLKYDPADSAFAIRPKNPLKIQFRPLKMETYAMFHSDLLDDLKVREEAPYYALDIGSLPDDVQEQYRLPPRNGQQGNIPRGELAVPDRYIIQNADPESSSYRPGQPPKWQEFDQNDRRASWSCVMARHNITFGNPVSIKNVTERERERGSELWDETRSSGLPFMVGEVSADRSFPFNDRYHQRLYWDDGNTVFGGEEFAWQRAGGVQQDRFGRYYPGSNSVGVVSASTTVNALDQIIFNTSNYFGMESYRASFSSSGKVRNYPSWGTSTNNYRASNTYHLAATIYAGHPKDQTIFDAASFAVHHYNPRPDYEGYYLGSKTDWAERYEEPENALVEDWLTISEPESEFSGAVLINDVTVSYAKDITDVGIREPSFLSLNSSNTGSATPVPVGTKLFSDGEPTVDEDEKQTLRPILPDAYSWLNLTRVGKLLPYRYKYYSTNLPALKLNELPEKPGVKGFNIYPSEEIGDVNNLPNEGVKARDLGFKAMIGRDGFGKNYRPGDVVGDEVSGLKFKVADVAPDGQVLRLHCFNADTGDAISPERFEVSPERLVGANSLIGKNDKGFGVEIKTISSEEGEGFSMSFFFGEVNENYSIDQKPEFAAREVQLSANADLTNSSDSDEFFGFVNEEITTPVAVSTTPSNGTFDIFLQAHNYTQFCFLSSETDYYTTADQQPTPCDEQYIELLISPQ